MLEPERDRSARSVALLEIARLFLLLGTVGFGGPAAHIAMLEDAVVVRRRWLTKEEFVDLLSACHLIPGPSSTELALHIGWRRAGFSGLLVAGICFILPAALIVTALAVLYLQAGVRPELQSVMYGLRPVVLAIVVQATWRLARAAPRARLDLSTIAAVAILSLFGTNEIVLLVLGAAAKLAGEGSRRPPAAPSFAFGALAVTGAVSGAGALGAASTFGLPQLFLLFLKVGAVLFGTGYVLVAYLRADLVLRYGLLTEGQLLDAVAIGQITPGPVLTTATFIGYLLAGPGGALVATVGIFLPAFIFVAISGPLIPRLRSSRAARILDGFNLASIGLMTAASFGIARTAIVDLPTALLGGGAVLALVRFRASPTLAMVVAAAAGALWHR